MKTQIPRFLLGSPQGWKSFEMSADRVVLPGFISYDTAACYCQTETPTVWELQPLGCDRVLDRLRGECRQTLKLIAINPVHARELSLAAVTLETACHALRRGMNAIDAEYRLMRDHWEKPWNHAKIARAPARSAVLKKQKKWCAACLHPQNMKFVGGQPLWFWLDWFDGKHILTELQTERGGNTEKEFFVFASREAAEGFYTATVARLLGRICDCQVESPVSSEFEVTMWEEGREVCNRTSASIGKRLW
jgi:hypothetical protein